MNKLRTTLEQYSRWKELTMYVDRMEAHLEADFSISVENAKALLESIGKEICRSKGAEIVGSVSVNSVLKKVFGALGYTSEELVTQISGSLANIGQMIGNLRNEISPTSHGKTLEELRERNNRVDLLTREFLVDSTLIVAAFLIRAFEDRNDASLDRSEEELKYEDQGEFNSSLDDLYGEFEIGRNSYVASEILFNVDLPSYRTEYKAYLESEKEMAEGKE